MPKLGSAPNLHSSARLSLGNFTSNSSLLISMCLKYSPLFFQINLIFLKPWWISKDLASQIKSKLQLLHHQVSARIIQAITKHQIIQMAAQIFLQEKVILESTLDFRIRESTRLLIFFSSATSFLKTTFIIFVNKYGIKVHSAIRSTDSLKLIK